MCGIAGVWQSQLSFSYQSAQVEACAIGPLMRRRGPDDFQWGSWLGGTVLCHSRLKIIDLSDGGRQPMTFSPDGSPFPFMLAFNGEIYNYRELRNLLQIGGEKFSSQSDTEVLLRMLVRNGAERSLRHCEGMWAFALISSNGSHLSLCRDRFGEKPLYYHRQDKLAARQVCPSWERLAAVYFGSEPKYIFQLLRKSLPVRYDQVISCLVNGYRALYKQPEQCMFEGLHEVRPGTSIVFDRRGGRVDSHYDPDWFLVPQEEEMTYEEAVQGVRERLLRAVELRLRADVPLAFCLSGGIDSNGIVAIAKKECGYDVQGFTVGHADERYAEQSWVKLAQEAYQIPVTWVKPNERRGFFSTLREMIRHRDGPVATASYFAHFWLMRAIADQGYKVALSGTGADELFSGYYDHHLWYLAQMARSGRTKDYLDALHAWQQKILPQVRNPDLKNPDRFLTQPGYRDHLYDGRQESLSFLRNGPEVREFTEEHFTYDLLRNRMLNELFYEVVPPILHEDDANAMFWGIENRSPYLDRELTRFVQTIPTRHLVRNGLAKSVLRDALRPWVPAAILDNPRKVGFNAPMEELLKTGRDRQELLRQDSPVYRLVKREKVVALLEQKSWTNAQSKFLFNLANVKIFLEMYG